MTTHIKYLAICVDYSIQNYIIFYVENSVLNKNAFNALMGYLYLQIIFAGDGLLWNSLVTKNNYSCILLNVINVIGAHWLANKELLGVETI